MGNTMLILIMIFVAIYLAKAVFTGKGKLMEAENIKKGKVEEYKKVIRLLYTAMFVMTILVSLVNIGGTYGYEQNYQFTFTEEYTDADGIVHPIGEQHTYDEMLEINWAQTESDDSSSSLCAVSSTETAPYTYETLEPTLNWEWMGFISYNALVVLNYICMGLSVVIVVAIFVVINKYTDKNAKEKAQQAAVGRKPSMPSGAFDFEEGDFEDPEDGK